MLLLSMALALTGQGARAQDRPAGEPPFPSVPTLVFPAFSRSGANARSDDAKEFRAAALRDLKASGAFHLLNPSGAAAGTQASAPTFWRVAGADLMFRVVSHSMVRGKLLVEGECINLATGAVILKKSFLGQTAVVDRMAHRMVDFLVGRVTGTPGDADSTIVFARATAAGVKEIFGVDRDGRNQRQLTAFGSLTIHPALAADGRLAFVTYKGGPPQIWGQLQPRGPFALLYPKEGQAGMALSDPAWSPDGQRLAFVQESRQGLADIQVLDLRSGKVARLTEGHTSKGPCWNPAGTAIAYISDRDGTPQVFVSALDGKARRLTGDPAPKGCLAWNGKGDRIAYSAVVEGRSAVFTVTPAGTDPRQAWSSPAPIVSLCWAPDGRSLLLGQQAGSASRLRIATLDGRIQDPGVSLDGGEFPQWVQNPAPAEVRTAQGLFPRYPVPGLLGGATMQR
jgi:TolB protein